MKTYQLGQTVIGQRGTVTRGTRVFTVDALLPCLCFQKDFVFWIRRGEEKPDQQLPMKGTVRKHIDGQNQSKISPRRPAPAKNTPNNCVGKGPVLSFPFLEACNDAYFKNTRILLCSTPTTLMMLPDKKNPLEELERVLPFKIHAAHQRCLWVAHQQEEPSNIIQLLLNHSTFFLVCDYLWKAKNLWDLRALQIASIIRYTGDHFQVPSLTKEILGRCAVSAITMLVTK